MKLQDVILRAIAKRITWMVAAEIAGVSDRTMRRIKQRYEEFGYDGLFDQRRGKRSIHRIPLEKAERILSLYQEKYFDFSVLHFHEKLRKEHGFSVSYSWVRQALQGAGLVKKRSRRGTHRRRRPRRPLPGMLLHIDGSKHQWLQDGRYYDLIVILDDATSEIYYAQLVDEESTATVMAGLREVVEKQGVFCALYSDRGSHFFYTPTAGGKVDKSRPTQVGRAMQELGIQTIAAYSPQARGRSERNFGTWQNRLPQELRVGRSRRWRRQIGSCESGTSRSSTRSFRWRRKERGRHFGGVAERIWRWFFRCRRSEWWTRTIRWRSGTNGKRVSQGALTLTLYVISRSDIVALMKPPLPPAVFHILVAVADRERHGYAIMQDVSARTDGALKLSPGTLYGNIKRLLEDGLIQELEARPDPEHDDTRRRYYRITALGRRVAIAESARLAKLLGQARASGLVAKRS